LEISPAIPCKHDLREIVLLNLVFKSTSASPRWFFNISARRIVEIISVTNLMYVVTMLAEMHPTDAAGNTNTNTPAG
jgi:hypothetical protein